MLARSLVTKGLTPLLKGSYEPVMASDEALVFIRRHETGTILCAFNFSNDTKTLDLPEGAWAAIPGAPYPVEISDKTITLGPWAAGFVTG